MTDGAKDFLSLMKGAGRPLTSRTSLARIAVIGTTILAGTTYIAYNTYFYDRKLVEDDKNATAALRQAATDLPMNMLHQGTHVPYKESSFGIPVFYTKGDLRIDQVITNYDDQTIRVEATALDKSGKAEMDYSVTAPREIEPPRNYFFFVIPGPEQKKPSPPQKRKAPQSKGREPPIT